MSVGRLVAKKGFDDLIRACAILRDRGEFFECTIAGSGPEEDKLNRLIRDLDLCELKKSEAGDDDQCELKKSVVGDLGGYLSK